MVAGHGVPTREEEEKGKRMRKRKRNWTGTRGTITAMGAALLLCCLWVGAAGAGELLPGGDFEEATAGALAAKAAAGPFAVKLQGKDSSATISSEIGVEGGKGFELKNASVSARTASTPAGVYELILQARGEGTITLSCGAYKRSEMPLGAAFHEYALIFETGEAGEIQVMVSADGTAVLDRVTLAEATAERKAAWKKQQDGLAQFGLMVANAQRPAPVEPENTWSMDAPPVAFVDKVVYFDKRYDPHWMQNCKALVDYLAANGFRVMDADALEAWMREGVERGAYGRVFILGLDILPARLAGLDGGEPLLMQFMKAGGRAVAVGSCPPLYRAQSLDRAASFGLGGHASILGVPGEPSWPIWRNNSAKAVVTEEGKRWGVTNTGYVTVAAYRKDVTVPLTGFYLDKVKGNVAVSWFKNYNPDYPWSGFLYLSGHTDMARVNLGEIYGAMLFGGESVEVPPVVRAKEEPDPYAMAIDLAGSLDRRAYRRGETIPLSIGIEASAKGAVVPDTLELQLLRDGKSLRGGRLAVDGLPYKADWPIDTTDYACGDYTLRIEFWRGDKFLKDESLDLYVCAPHVYPGFYFGAWGDARLFSDFRRRKALEEHREVGLHPGNNGGAGRDYLDLALRMGLYTTLRTGCEWNEKGEPTPGSLSKRADGSLYTNPWRGRAPTTTLALPKFRREAREKLAKWAKGIRDAAMPAVLHDGHVNDDWSLMYPPDWCEVATEGFRMQTGLDAPREATHPEPGVVPEDDPWLQWWIYTLRDVNGAFMREQTAGFLEGLPDGTLHPIPGGMQIPLWYSAQYPPLQFGENGFNSVGYYMYMNFWQPNATVLYKNDMGRMGNRDLPLWVTPGFYHKDEPTYYRNMFYLHLSGAPQGLNYFKFSTLVVKRPNVIPEVKKWAREVVEPYAPLLGKLRPGKPKVALLLSLTQSIHQSMYPISAAYPYINLKAAHVDFHTLCEEEVIDGKAAEYDAVLLWHGKWLREKAHAALCDYAKNGGKVLIDKSTTLEIPGATRLPVDLAMGASDNTAIHEADPRFGMPGQKDYLVPERVDAVKEAVEKHVKPAFSADTREMTISRVQAGGIDYLWLVHIHDHEDYLKYGVSVSAGKKPTEEELQAYYDRMEKKAADMGGVFRAKLYAPEGYAYYDVLKRKPLPLKKEDAGRTYVDVSMETLGGTLIGLYPQKLKSIAIEIPETLERAKAYALRIKLTAEDGNPMPGHMPVRVRVSHAYGTFDEWTGSYVTENGVVEIPFRPAKNHPTGVWQIQAEDLSAGKIARAAVRVE